MFINMSRQSQCPYDALLVTFLNGQVTGMINDKENEKSYTEELPEVYRLAVILVICVIFKADEISQLATL